ncbi:MAG: nickel pincer cofactor biosynthesis protein LarB [Chitinispirillales bacterium]|jgi:NCAIR mutase (PurE)-related protein|nr:nickel pincer cofactor biosynthesis protein LarB [Chitinispirillales bacterium]
MDKAQTYQMLLAVKSGEMSPDEALLKLKLEPYSDLSYAKIDNHRGVRQGIAEVIFGQGKTAEQIAGIIQKMLENGRSNILVTRLDGETAGEIQKSVSLEYKPVPRLGIVAPTGKVTGKGYVVVATGGTSDIPVAEEAAVTAEILGSRVERLFDVGVAGIHRLLDKSEVLMSAKAVVAVAGMEGALASVVGGLVDCPVIAVPTSIGYGASFGGVAALLSMLNSCSSGVSVVNIDNGFGAGYLANMIAHI